MKYYLGIDVGSTTVKLYLTDENDKCLFSKYTRHFSDVRKTIYELLIEVKNQMGDIDLYPVMTGSGGLSLADKLGISFIQEVIACTKTVETYIPQTDVVIELGGEDAKITYFEGQLEQRMNGTCAGGTGAFIDQMATLLKTDAAGLNEYAKNYKTIYPIASRCGVFAKTDIQPLINEGVSKEDIAVSIFQAVVNQTISGLACGKPIRGHVAFLGGPLHFLSELREAFIRTLKLDDEHIIAPKYSHLFAAVGSALNSKKDVVTSLGEMQKKLDAQKAAAAASSKKTTTTSGSKKSTGSASSGQTTSQMVWIPTHGGKKYHSNPNCSGMKGPEKVSLSTAKSRGFTACKKCY